MPHLPLCTESCLGWERLCSLQSLPFPALDGGSIVFALYELITRKKVKSEIVGYASFIGFALLMILAIYVTAGDIIDLVK